MKKTRPKGREGFESFYSDLFQERWPVLREALLAPKQSVARVNTFASPTGALNGLTKASWSTSAYESKDPIAQPNGPEPLEYFMMDGASIVAAEALDVQAGDDVLDLCAAPGGKSLILAERIADGGSLVVNDRSAARRGRLKRVLESYLPDEIRGRIRVTGHDATKWCVFETEAYDRILLDAPCSSERHVLHDENALTDWSLSRVKQLAQRQYAMLASALLVLRVGGRMVYSTCALAPQENDKIVEKLLKKKGDKVRVVETQSSIGEPTPLGWHILPDTSPYGPIYFSVLERTA